MEETFQLVKSRICLALTLVLLQDPDYWLYLLLLLPSRRLTMGHFLLNNSPG